MCILWMSVSVVRMLKQVHENYAKSCTNFCGKKNMSRITKGAIKKGKTIHKKYKNAKFETYKNLYSILDKFSYL